MMLRGRTTGGERVRGISDSNFLSLTRPKLRRWDEKTIEISQQTEAHPMCTGAPDSEIVGEAEVETGDGVSGCMALTS